MGLINNIAMKFLKIILLLIVLLGFMCCIEKKYTCPNVYGLDYNKERRELGMPIIEKDWVIHNCDTNFVYWSNRQNRVISENPIHLWKRIYLKEKKLVQEEDVFHYESNTDKAYRLVTRWFPIESGTDSVSFRLITFFKNEFPPTTGENIDFLKADSVLNVWGFKSISFNQR